MLTTKELSGLPGARVAESSPYGLDSFIEEYLKPLLFWRSYDVPHPTSEAIRKLLGKPEKDIHSEEEFWEIDSTNVFKRVRLKEFVLVDWFPRAPGVACSKHAASFLARFRNTPLSDDPMLGEHYTPQIKGSLVQDGGIGTIRLRPKKIDGKDSWYATALKGRECHRGIPLVISDSLLKKSSVKWGETVTIEGQIRFMQDADLAETASYVHHALPLVVFVDALKGTKPVNTDPVLINPVVLLDGERKHYREHQFAFVNCGLSETEIAVDWLERYAKKFDGHIVTNFDEQEPAFSDAPLSYQRLVAKTYDRTIIEHLHGSVTAEHIDQVIDNSFTNSGEIHMGHNIDISGGSANISIDSTGVNQTISSTNSLEAPQKAQLEQMVAALMAELNKLKSDHADEKEAIESALKNAIATAVKPPAERKKSILQVSAKGLKDAADLVKDIAPAVITTAGLIVKFIAGL